MGKVFAVGVGPGSQNYITEIVRKVIVDADVVVGYKYTLDIISSLIQGKKVHVITMEDQEKTYQQIKKELEGGILVVPFTCLLYTSPSPRDVEESRMPSSA